MNRFSLRFALKFAAGFCLVSLIPVLGVPANGSSEGDASGEVEIA